MSALDQGDRERRDRDPEAFDAMARLESLTDDIADALEDYRDAIGMSFDTLYDPARSMWIACHGEVPSPAAAVAFRAVIGRLQRELAAAAGDAERVLKARVDQLETLAQIGGEL